jgi:hypothetical protein
MRKPGFYIILSLLVFSSGLRAEHRLPLHSLKIHSIAGDSVSSIIPFNRVGNLMLVKARVDTTEGNFVLDTGAPHLVLNLTYFRDYPSEVAADGEGAGIGGASAPLITTSVGKLSLGAFEFSRLNADLVNLGNIENAKGVKVLGLLGVDLFRDCEMIIDFEKNLIYLHRISKKQAATYRHETLKDQALYRVFPIELIESRIIVTTEMAGKKLKLVVDCAAETNVLDSRLPDKIFENFVITGKVKVTGPGNKKIDALMGTIQNMKIGSHDMGNMIVTVTNLERSCFAEIGCVNGILGFNFLSMHKLGFNFVTRKMYLWK